MSRQLSQDAIERRKERWRSFLMEDAQPGMMFMLNHPDPDVDPNQQDPNYLYRLLNFGTNRERADRAIDVYESFIRNKAYVADDLIPHAPISSGTEIFAEAFGCQVHRTETNMPFALPMITQSSEVASIAVPDLFDTPLANLFEIADMVRDRLGNDVTMKIPDIQSPMDITALIWEKTELLIAMMAEPEAVIELSGKVTQLLTQFLDEWFRRYGTEFIAHYPFYFVSGGMTLSEDEVGIVNPAMFDQFFLPHLEELSSRYGGIGIHCCADSEHQWDNFKKVPNLRLLNLNRNSKSAKEAYEFFAGHTACMHYGWQPTGDPATWPSQYPVNSRHVLDLHVESRDKAIEIAEILNASEGRFTV